MAHPRTDTYTATALQTVFPYTFWVPDDATLNVGVYQIAVATGITTKLVEGVGAGKFVVSTRGNQSGGNVTLGTGAPENDTIVIQSEIPMGTFTLFTQAGEFSAAAINDQFQRTAESFLDLERRAVTESPHLPPQSLDTVDTEMPVPVALESWRWDATGLALESYRDLTSGIPDDIEVCFGDSDDYCFAYDSAADRLELRNEASTPIFSWSDTVITSHLDRFDVNPGADSTIILGKARLDDRDAGDMTLSHTGFTGISDFAVQVQAAGHTRFNAPSGALHQLSIGDVAQTNLTASLFTLISNDFIVAGGGLEVTLGEASFGEALGLTSTVVSIAGTLSLKEIIAPPADTVAYGQYWVKTQTPNSPWFTDDGGTDRQLMRGDGTTVVDESVFVSNGTTGGILKETAVIITVAGAVTGVTTLVTSGILTSNSNADGTTILGRAKIGSVLADEAHFSHFDHFTVTNSALHQNNVGRTTLNGASGTSIVFSINDVTVATMASSTAAFLGEVGLGGIAATNSVVNVEGSISLAEQAAADADTAAFGQVWVKNTTPNELWFTDDAGTDVQLGLAGAIDGVGTVGTIPVFVTDTETIGDSVLVDSGTVFTLTGRDLTLNTGDIEVTAGGLGIGIAPATDLHISTPTGGHIRLERVDTSVLNTNHIGSIDFYGGEGGTEVKVGRIKCEAAGTWTSVPDDVPTRLLFETTPVGGTGSVLVMTLDSDESIIMESLAGTGSRTVVADANGKLSAP